MSPLPPPSLRLKAPEASLRPVFSLRVQTVNVPMMFGDRTSLGNLLRPLTFPKKRLELSMEEVRRMRRMEATGEVSNFLSTPRDQAAITERRPKFSRLPCYCFRASKFDERQKEKRLRLHDGRLAVKSEGIRRVKADADLNYFPSTTGDFGILTFIPDKSAIILSSCP